MEGRPCTCENALDPASFWPSARHSRSARGRSERDNVKLDGGGSLTGSVMTGSKVVTVRTATSGLIVFDRADVKQVTHGHTAAAKTASNAADAKTPPKKRKLTAEEEAWMPKVRHVGLAALRRRSRQIAAGPQRASQHRRRRRHPRAQHLSRRPPQRRSTPPLCRDSP